MKPTAKPYRNQRVSRPKQRKQQQLLEVSVRAEKEWELRTRAIAGVVFKLLVVAGLLGGVWFGAREGLQRFFWGNPFFDLTDVRVGTDGTLTREQIIHTAAIAEGRNILLTDLAQAQKALTGLPQVERVSVQRTLPGRLDISITERQPIAWVLARGETDPTASEKSWLIDARGYVMKSRKLMPEYLHFPIISGFETGNLVAGRKVIDLEIQAALELLRVHHHSTRWPLGRIDVAKGYCLVVTGRNRAQITFGLDHIEQQLARFYRVLDAAPKDRELLTVNLLVERNTPVTFYDPEAEAVAAETVGTATKATSEATPAPAKAARATPKPEPSPTRGKPLRDPVKKKEFEAVRKPFRLNG